MVAGVTKRVHYAWVVAAATFVVLVTAAQFGAAFAAWGAGASRTWPGSYQPASLLAGALGVLAAMMSVSVGRRALLHPSPASA